MAEEKSALEKIEAVLKEIWRQSGQASIIAAKHTEFVVEPKIFLGDKLNPEILKMLVVNYLAQTSKQDSGTGHVEIKADKLVIKTPKGKPVVVVRDKKLIHQYLQARS